jgi:hypothetical protein
MYYAVLCTLLCTLYSLLFVANPRFVQPSAVVLALSHPVIRSVLVFCLGLLAYLDVASAAALAVLFLVSFVDVALQSTA